MEDYSPKVYKVSDSTEHTITLFSILLGKMDPSLHSKANGVQEFKGWMSSRVSEFQEFKSFNILNN